MNDAPLALIGIGFLIWIQRERSMVFGLIHPHEHDYEARRLTCKHRFVAWSRREFLGMATLAGSAALLGFGSELIAADGSPETVESAVGRGSAFTVIFPIARQNSI
jgi:hypothetical protein